ncbi:hypothetical protein V8G54_026527, partial [Vigna mungo]
MELFVLSAGGLTQSKIMNLRGWVQGRKVLVLIVSGASHNLISTRLVEESGLKSEDVPPYNVYLGDGAALSYDGNCWLLCLTTDSLADARYPGAASLGDAVGGMATTRINSKHFLFWFRSHTAKEVKWGRDYKAIVQSLSPLIPPIFSSDESACCSEWNAAMERLTGWKRDEVIGKLLPGEICGSFCRLKGQDNLTNVMILIYRGISGQDYEKLPVGFFYRNGEFIQSSIIANKRIDVGGNILGCFCFLQVVTSDLNQFSEEHKPISREN